MEGALTFSITLQRPPTGLVTNKKKASSEIWSSIVDDHWRILSAYPKDTAVVIKSYFYPKLDGVQYFATSEPHNGSIIALVTGRVSIPHVSEWDEPRSMELRRIALVHSMNKTVFVFARENVWQTVGLRQSCVSGPSAEAALEDLESQFALGDAEDFDDEGEGDGEEDLDEEDEELSSKFSRLSDVHKGLPVVDLTVVPKTSAGVLQEALVHVQKAIDAGSVIPPASFAPVRDGVLPKKSKGKRVVKKKPANDDDDSASDSGLDDFDDD